MVRIMGSWVHEIESAGHRPLSRTLASRGNVPKISLGHHQVTISSPLCSRYKMRRNMPFGSGVQVGTALMPGP
jgi:hypothetical protein